MESERLADHEPRLRINGGNRSKQYERDVKKIVGSLTISEQLKISIPADLSCTE
ncbi:MAG: hypothetical protein Q7N87_02320 [Candidatus Uhrbacteria bacterium]|nr:hypothetical protein [Candidatus Uhrbacteria bacterium]